MDKAIAKPWLTLQCQMIPGVRHAVFAAEPTADGEFSILETLPEGASAPPQVLAALQAALDSGTAEVRNIAPDDCATEEETTWIVACPLRRGGTVCGAVAVEVGGIEEGQVPIITRLMLWGSAWPAFLLERHEARGEQCAGTLQEVIGAALQSDDFLTACNAVATVIARAFEADSAAIGMLDAQSARLAAISGRALFDQRSDDVRAIERALDEACQQDGTITWPVRPDAAVPIADAHAALANLYEDPSCVCTAPLRVHGTAIGGLTLMRARARPFAIDEVGQIEQLADLLGPALEVRQHADRSGLARLADEAGAFAARLFGPAHLRLKTLIVGALALCAVLSFSTGNYEVTAPAVLEGNVQRDLVAPIDGFIGEAHVRAGARVEAGEVLATLDDKALALEHARLESQLEELANEHRRALGVLDRGATRVLAAQLRQTESRLALVAEELARTRIVAPFGGLIVSGDLSQSLGSPVSRGDLLFRIAPLEGYRVILEVEAGDVASVREGAEGRLVLSAIPRARFPIRVERMNGIAGSRDGRNVLEAEALLLGESDQLRPGMKGVARIEAGRARLLWMWTHRLVDRMRLWWWAWSPVA